MRESCEGVKRWGQRRHELLVVWAGHSGVLGGVVHLTLEQQDVRLGCCRGQRGERISECRKGRQRHRARSWARRGSVND